MNGHPGSGKTTLAQHLSKHLSIALFSKDGMKERLFDTLGHSDRPWSRKLGAAASAMLWDVGESLLRVGSPVILESNFYPEWDNARVARVEREFACRTFQVVLTADSETLIERYMRRIGSPDRHPGHWSDEYSDELKGRLRSEFVPVKITGATMVVDTSDLGSVSYEPVVSAIEWAR